MLDNGRLGFGIATPKTAQRTALKKNQSSDPRAVMNGKFLNIENDAESRAHENS